MYKIILVGTGNVAWHLASALEDGGNQIVGIYGRKLINSQQLARKLFDAKIFTDLNFESVEADLVLLALADKAYGEIIKKMQIPKNALVAHTSGTLPMSLLQKFPKHGVFYPLQTFSKDRKIDVRKIPFCLEASQKTSLDILVDIADSVSDFMYHISTSERQKLHVSAVFACNFTNHLLAISKEILEKNDMDFEMLYPLINETIQKALENSPKTMQTGPAIRNDQEILHTHLTFLKNTPYAAIYELLSKDIQRLGKEKK